MPKNETAAEYAARMGEKLKDDLPVVRRIALTNAIMERGQELGMPRDQMMNALDAAQRRARQEWQ